VQSDSGVDLYARSLESNTLEVLVALDIDTAKAIVDVVCTDVSSRRILDDYRPPPTPSPPFIDPPTGFVPPMPLHSALESLHLAGAARNLAMVLLLKGLGDKEFDEKICTGIALTTKAAIVANLINGKLSKVRSSYMAERVVNGYAHKATGVGMRDGTDYVFDWWKTLNPLNPLVSSLAEWRVASKSVEYRAFKGLP
jgi:hypothetical protein